ncbi:MAG TPA: precorrin-4 C(11)-methyltransferase, partial [Lachnospiraceae bacterium]|nr:precorrin-4 C(11)-methyltransferase [Lachnospiraceae bacterium]
MVHFVGAGPGAADLITVRGAELLRKADIIIYAGSLVNRELLSYAPETAKIYDSKDMNLQQIIEVMKDAENAGLETVRLHTGEPSLYGAVREQMDELDKLGIEYDSCPGVSAAFGAAAALNLEYTLPEVSQSLIITRMEGRTGVPERESIESFAAHNASMAIYLSAGMLEELSARLINGGYRPDTPAAIVYKATWPEEKKFVTTIAQMAETAKKEGIRNHAVVLVGDAVGHEKYDKSKLYSDGFTTEFRTAGVVNNIDELGTVGDDVTVKQDRVGEAIQKEIYGKVINRFAETDIFVFTDRAEKLADKVKEIMSDLGNCDTAIFRCRMDEVKKRLSYSFDEKRAAVFI